MAGESSVSTVAKPVMRGLLQSQIKKNLIISLTLAGIGGYMFKRLVNDRRKQAYRDFYKNYDGEKEFEEMRKKGLFQSC